MQDTKTPNQIPSGFTAVESVRKHEYKTGAKVKTIYNNTEEYFVKEHAGSNSWGVPEYMLENVKTGKIIYHMESELQTEKGVGIFGAINDELQSELELELFGGFIEPKCECGAAFTQFPDNHMQFCPLYKEFTND